MNQNNRFQRLRLLDQAQKQLDSLKSVKNNLKYQCTSKDKDQQILMLNSRVKNLISLYEDILSKESCTKVDNKQKQTDNVSYRRSHSRTKLSLEQTKIKKKQISIMIVNSTLTCTIAYLQTNFLGSFQQAATILLNSKDELYQFIQKLKSQKDSLINRSGRKSHFSNFGLRQKGYNNRDQEQSERSSISLSKFYTKSNYHTGATNKQQAIQQNHYELYLVYTRTCMNLVINLILLNRQTFAMQIFNQLVQSIEKLDNQSCKAKIISYIFIVLFNIQSQQFITWKEKVKSFTKNLNNFTQERLSLQQAVSLSHFIFNSDLFSPQQQDPLQENYPLHFIKILQKSIQTFLQNQLFQLAFFTLRHLLQCPISPQLKQNYYIQLREMLESGKLQEDIQLQNIESVQCFKSIIESLNTLTQKYLFEDKFNERSFEQSKIDLFHIVVKLQISKISNHPQIMQQQKDFLIQKLKLMKSQTNYITIDSMLSQKQSKNIIKNIQQKINKIVTFSQCKLLNQYNNFFKNFKTQNMALTQKSMNFSNTPVNKQQEKLKIITPSHSRKYLKVVSTSVLSENSFHHQSNSQKLKIFQSNISTFSNDHKKVSKMVRLCQHGGFLNKRNFNSDGGQIKFIKITNNKIKWSKNPQKIDESSHSYPLKDIKGIIYGKVTPNFKKSCNKQLKEQLCFSLILQKRTMDFYCKDYKQVESWVCGLSSILKRHNSQITGYTPGKMRWRKMFTILRQAFIQPLKIHERNNFYFQNAYSLILFKQNGYKLLSTKKIL